MRTILPRPFACIGSPPNRDRIPAPRGLGSCLLLAALLLPLAACNRNAADHDAEPSSAHVIAVIPKGTTHIFWQSVHAGANKAGQEFGYQIHWNGPERETDRERQIQIIEDFIVQKVDGIVLAPLDREALVPSVEKLASLKIPCAIIDSGINTDKYVCFAATDNYQGGVMAARRMGEVLQAKGKVVVVKYVPGSASTTERENGFIETIQKEFPNIQIVDAKYGQDTVETALQATEDLLTRHPDLQGLYACNASTSVGALQGLQSQKRTEVKMVGFDAEKALLDGLRAGQIDALVVQNPFKMGYEGVKAVVSQIKGQPVAKRIDTGVEIMTRPSLEDPRIKDLLKLQ
jgi:ribose transport system substrate-binding protein